MGSSCKESAQALIDCMKKTKCMKEGGDFRTCLKAAKENDDCQVRSCGHSYSYRFDMDLQVVHNAYFLCKRSMLDMRSRIRGPRVY